MSDLLQTGAAWLQGQLKEHASRTVTYRRGGQSVTLAATLGQSVLKLTDGVAAWVERTERDYLIAVADLVLGGTAVKPARGDRIEDSTDGRIYEVMSPKGEAPFRDDSRRVWWRVRTKDVGAL